MILYSYFCPVCDQEFEEFARLDDYAKPSPCPVCGKEAPRKTTFPTIDPLLGLDAECFPTMAQKWADKREQRARFEKRLERDHGVLNSNPGADVKK